MNEINIGDSVRIKGQPHSPTFTVIDLNGAGNRQIVKVIVLDATKCDYGTFVHQTVSEYPAGALEVVPANTSKFKEGDLVRLRSGSCDMTVQNARTKGVRCRWTLRGQIQSEWFSPALLKISPNNE